MIKVFFLKNYLLFKKGTLNLIKRLGLRKFLFNTPSQFISIKKWIEQNTDLDGVQYYHLDDSVIINEPPPVIVSSPVTKRFSKYYHRFTPELFVAIIPDGRVMGESCNIIITPDYKVLADVSREFGAEGGKKIQDFSIFNSAKKMPLLKHISGNIAVISTCGSANFHHWNYDILPRFQLLKDAGVFNEIDYFLLDYKGLSFQKAGIDELQIDEKKIINTHGKKDFYIQAEKLFIPSLTEELGTINPRVVKFLRETFLHKDTLLPEKKTKLYISRKNATSRRIINEHEVMEEIVSRGYYEFIPEEYTIFLTAAYFNSANAIVSVHGSGLSNLCFISEKTKVLDMLAPYHQDGYYWMLCNQQNALYTALFAEGDHPPDDLDLVITKNDSDLLIDIKKLRIALDFIERN